MLRAVPAAVAEAQSPGDLLSSYSTMTGDQMVAILRHMGFTPTLTRDQDGDPLVNFQIEGLQTSVYYYSGSNGNYGEIQFYAGFSDTPSLDKVNAWNRDHRFGRAYLSAQGKLHVEYDVALEGGVTEEYLENSVRQWHTVLNSFTKYFE